MFGKKREKIVNYDSGHYHQLNTIDLIRLFIISKLPVTKQSFQRKVTEAQSPPENISVNHIAIVLDGVVEETIQCQNRLAALLLSNPSFVEYNPEEDKPIIGSTAYVNNAFVYEEVSLENEDL